MDKLLSGVPVSLEEMLVARERRVFEQNKLLEKYQGVLICFTLNIPGEVKCFPLAERAFSEGIRLIERQLSRHKKKILLHEKIIENTGFTAFFAVSRNNADDIKSNIVNIKSNIVNIESSALDIKRLMTDIEESSEIGRVFDIDVLTKDGKVSRSEVGKGERKCYICDSDAFLCARNKTHEATVVFNRIADILTDYFCNKFIDCVAKNAARALLYEVCATPKPGLVDLNNNGSHRDMDVLSFADSTAALITHFRKFVHIGIESKKLELKELFRKLRYPGMEAYDDMLLATGEVNTHKGAVFSLGVLCGALGFLHEICLENLYGENMNDKITSGENAIEESRLFETCALMVEDIIERELKTKTSASAVSSGERAYLAHNVTGARGEAASGFLSIRKYALPIFKSTLYGMQKISFNEKYSLNIAGVITLLNLMANVHDTNILKRGEPEAQTEIKKSAKACLDGMNPNSLEDFLKTVLEMDREFIQKNISPGGCADLLALTYFIHFLECDGVLR